MMCFLSFVLTYGYEEGTMRSNAVGKIAKVFFNIFKFPSGYILPTEHLVFSLLLNIVIFSVLFTAIVSASIGKTHVK